MTDLYADWDRFFSAGRGASDYVGLNRQEAEERARANGVTAIRVANWEDEQTTFFTADLRPSRLNLLLHHGRVVRANFG